MFDRASVKFIKDHLQYDQDKFVPDDVIEQVIAENKVDKKARVRYEKKQHPGDEDNWASRSMVDLKAHHVNLEGQKKLQIATFN